jgi:uncharacterized Zn-finger protein
MIPTYRDADFDDQTLTCPKCNWQGQGHRAVVIDFYGVTDNKEVHCPQCDETIATVKTDADGPPGESANDLSFQLG